MGRCSEWGVNTGYSSLYHIFNKCSLSICCTTDIVLSNRVTQMNEICDIRIIVEVTGRRDK